MAFRPLLAKRGTVVAATSIVTSTLLVPLGVLHAEAPPSDSLSSSRKPIYDDLPTAPTPDAKPSSPQKSTPKPSPPATASSPTPTDRLAAQIGRARTFTAAHVGIAEDKFNAAMSRALSLEESFTSTIASLAPDPRTGEKVLPGALYVLVAAMAGSIVARNRNIVLRAVAPVAVGVGAGWVLLPRTSRNVADLVWRYEERWPVVAENHLRVRAAAIEAWKQAKGAGQGVGEWADGKVRRGRESVEDWVRKGR